MSALMLIYICTSVFAQPYTFSSSGSGSVSRSPWHTNRPSAIRSESVSGSGSVLPSILYTYPSSPSTTNSVTTSVSVSPSLTGTRLEKVTVTQTVTQTVLLPVIITVTKTITVTETVTPTLTPLALLPLPGTKSSGQDYIIIITFSVIGFVVALVIVVLIVTVINHKKKMASPMASSPKHVVYENRARFSVDSMPNNWHPQTRDLSV